MAFKLQLEIHFHERNKVSVRLPSRLPDEITAFAEFMLFACFALRQLSNLGQGGAGLAFFLGNTITGRNGLDLPAGSPSLVNFTGTAAQKRFEASLDAPDEKRATFLLNPKGFGIFGWDMNYYAPQSVLLLWKYLAGHHTELEEDFYRWQIDRSAKLCSQAFLSGQVNMLNQEAFAWQIAQMALKG